MHSEAIRSIVLNFQFPEIDSALANSLFESAENKLGDCLRSDRLVSLRHDVSQHRLGYAQDLSPGKN